MSSPPPPIPLSILSRPTPPSPRNIANAYGLAIPPPSQRRSTYQRRDTPTQYLDPPEPASRKKGTPYLSIPKATVVVSERAKLYNYDGDSKSPSSTMSRQDRSYSPERPEKRRGKVDDRVLACAVTSMLALFIAIGIPLGVILPQKYIEPLPIKVLVPFYLKPEQGSWDRLEDTIVKHHDMHFTVVVDPSNGPGNMSWPSVVFGNAVKRINMYPNVQTLGYINTYNGALANATVRSQIATYALWSNVTEDLALHGVYFDRTPWRDEGDGVAKAYMQNVSAVARRIGGWAMDQQGMVVYNPGRVPDANMMAYAPDITVVFEGAYSDVPKKEEMSAQLAAVESGRDSCAMLIHSVPKDLGRGELRRIIENVRREVEWLYLTDLTENVYTDYASFWDDWLDVAW